MLLLLAGSSYLLLKDFNANSIKVSSSTKTSKALKTAKEVLLSYSVSYPDLGNDGGPGYLPCPDISNDGFAAGNCSFSGGTTIGYFPYKTLDTKELRDGNGQRLWYVISERYRYGANKTVPMNSDIADDSINNLDLNIDNGANTIDDIVAIIIAPGEPLEAQTRTSNPSDTVNLDPNNFMEDENADQDQIYTSEHNSTRNDRLILITRSELLAAVERRVMGDVVAALQNYHSNHNALPWLSPYTDPSVSSFHSEIGSTGNRGHIPFHWSNDEPGISTRNPFDTQIGWKWHTDIGTATGSYSGTVSPDCLRNVDCDDGLFPPITAVRANSIECIWSDRMTVNCAESDWIEMTETSCNAGGCPQAGTCTRYYKVDMPEFTGTDININDPDENRTRIRDVVLEGQLEEANRAIEIIDIYRGRTLPSCDNNTITIGDGHINFINSTTGSIEAVDLKYDIDIDAGELPEWFVKNQWHELIYIAYAEGEPYPGNTGTACTDTSVTCLNIDYVTPHNTSNLNAIRALAIMAGRELDIQDRSLATLSQYLEGDNVDSDIYNFTMNTTDNSINDSIKVIFKN